ncbi:hypothetical protein CJJ09_003686 [Candidozyma auris]|nr:hypothetical protein CJJ09_003686 [[Candida] auris]
MNVAGLTSPTFFIKDVRLSFDLENNIEGLSISNNLAYIVLGNRIHRFSLENPSNVDTVLLPRQYSSHRITQYWAHINSSHLIVQLDSFIVLYLHSAYTKFKVLYKLNGLGIHRLDYSNGSEDTESTEFIVTTTDNRVYVCFIKSHQGSKAEGKRDDKHVKQVFKADDRVLGLCISNVENRIYLFAGCKIFYWEKHTMHTQSLYMAFQAAPHTLYLAGNMHDFEIFIESGFYYAISHDGKLIETNDDEAKLASDSPLINSPFVNIDSLVTTSHYYVLLKNESLQVQDKLLTQPSKILRYKFDHHLKGIRIDPIFGTIWMYSASSIHELVYENESASIWYGYYSLGRYDDALRLLESSSDNLETSYYASIVKAKKGYESLQRGGFGSQLSSEKDSSVFLDLQYDGVKLLAKSGEPFEKVSLMLLKSHHQLSANIWNLELLIAYLSEKLKRAIREKSSRQAWAEANNALLEAIKFECTLGKSLVYETSTILLQRCPQLCVETWLKIKDLEFQKLLPAIVTYNKRFGNLSVSENAALYYMSILIHEKSSRDASVLNTYLSMLMRHPDGDNSMSTKPLTKVLNYIHETKGNDDLTYDTKMILRLALDHKKLWPAIMIMIHEMRLYESSLKLAIDNSDLSLAEFVLQAFEDSLLQDDGRSLEQTTVVRSLDRDDSTIDLSEESHHLRKRLWILFAKFLLTNPSEAFKLSSNTIFQQQIDASTISMKEIMRYILSLAKITHMRSPIDVKSLLQLLPESVEISELREIVVNSIDSYNDNISSLTLEMKESARISTKLRKQIVSHHETSHKGNIAVLVEAGEACSLCHRLLLEKSIVVFPNCQHAFHRDCVARFHLRQRGEYKFREILKRLRQYNLTSDRNELDSMFIRQCVLCHDANLGSIDEEIIDRDNDKAQLNEWSL